jgi:uroporphyrinogen decarboxylase
MRGHQLFFKELNLTPRERVIASVSHEEPDKIPIDLNGTMVTSLTRIAYMNLRRFLGLTPDGTIYDEYHIRWRKASYYYDVIEHPLADKAISDLKQNPWPDEHDSGRYDGLREEARELYEKTDKCIIADIPGLGPFEGGCFLRGHANFCMDLYIEPVYAEAVLDKVTDSMILFWGSYPG